MSLVLGFAYKYFFEAILVFLTGMITKYLIKQFGKERAQAIRDAVLTAMLYAEETFGIGHGDEKWSKAWQTIIKLLKDQGITLTEKEIVNTTTLMKSTVPEVNAITYSALPNELKCTRDICFMSVGGKKLMDELKKKHKVKKS